MSTGELYTYLERKLRRTAMMHPRVKGKPWGAAMTHVVRKQKGKKGGKNKGANEIKKITNKSPSLNST